MKLPSAPDNLALSLLSPSLSSLAGRSVGLLLRDGALKSALPLPTTTSAEEGRTGVDGRARVEAEPFGENEEKQLYLPKDRAILQDQKTGHTS